MKLQDDYVREIGLIKRKKIEELKKELKYDLYPDHVFLVGSRYENYDIPKYCAS